VHVPPEHRRLSGAERDDAKPRRHDALASRRHNLASHPDPAALRRRRRARPADRSRVVVGSSGRFAGARGSITGGGTVVDTRAALRRPRLAYTVTLARG
jgi:hypothetical protein